VRRLAGDGGAAGQGRAARHPPDRTDTSDRNWFDRPNGDPTRIRTITWNRGWPPPIEFSCDGDPGKPVLRDATASSCELAHAAQDCDGLDPTANEFDAVRIESIYRRAAGLCQRTVYGTDRCRPG
jgi:hypothetical protein